MRNLEAEYRKSQQEETPDLWNRIESALPEKKLVKAVRPTFVPDGNDTSAQKSKKIYKFARFTKAAAAVLIMALIIPGAWVLMNRATDVAESDTAAMDTAAMDNAAMDTADAGVADMNAASEGAMAGDTTGGGVVTMDSDGASNGYSYEESGADSVGSGEPAELQADTESIAELKSAPEICEEMTLESIEKEESDGQAGQETIYRLRTAEGEVLVTILSQDISTVLTSGNTYRFTLEAVSGEAWEYQIVNVETIEAD